MPDAAVTSALVIGGYVLGTFPTAVLVGRSKGFDPTTSGSGNPGASNATRIGGRRAGATVLLGDLGLHHVVQRLGAELGRGLAGQHGRRVLVAEAHLALGIEDQHSTPGIGRESGPEEVSALGRGRGGVLHFDHGDVLHGFGHGFSSASATVWEGGVLVWSLNTRRTGREELFTPMKAVHAMRSSANPRWME